MLRRLLALLFGAPQPKLTPVQLWAELQTLLDADTEWDPGASQDVCRQIYRLAHAEALDLGKLRSLLEPWYAEHPITLEWSNGYDLHFVDPLRVEIDAVALDDGDRGFLGLRPWASLLRSLQVVDGGIVFHHGFDASELLRVLRDAHAPTVTALRVLGMIDYRPHELNQVIAHVIDHPTMNELIYLGLNTCFGPEHITALARSDRGAQLEALDLCELLCDTGVDDEPLLLETLRSMSGFDNLRHLNMYNNVHTAEHLEALVSNEYPQLTHLALGSADVDDRFAAVLRGSHAFPRLQWLQLYGGRAELADWAEQRGIERV